LEKEGEKGREGRSARRGKVILATSESRIAQRKRSPIDDLFDGGRKDGEGVSGENAAANVEKKMGE